MECPSWVPAQPRLDLLMFVSSVIVEHDVNQLACRDLSFDGIEELNELLMPVALFILADDRAVQNVECSEQRGCAVALIVTRHCPDTTWLHRQTGLGAIERLDLSILVDGQNDGVSR